MNIETLQIFIAVAEKQSFAQVADDLNLAPSSISRAIAGLEDQLDLRLFHRTTRKVSLTEAGQTYYNQIAPIIADLQDAAEMARDVTEVPKGAIRLTSSVTFGREKLIPILHQFMEAYPDIHLHYQLTDQLVDLVTERIDIAIRHGKLEDSSFVARKLFDSCYRIIASPDYIEKSGRPNQPEEITEHACLIFDWPYFKDKWKFKDKTGHVMEVPVQGRYQMTNGAAVRDFTLHGAGVALLPSWLVDADIQSGRFIDLFPEYQVTAHHFNTGIWLMTPSRSHIPLRNRLLLDFIRERLVG